MRKGSRQAAEAFIEDMTRRAGAWPREDPETLRARAELARQEADLGRRELQAGGLDPARLDALAAERSKARRELAEQAHRRAVAASDAVARRLAELTPVPTRPADPMDVLIDRVTFIRSFADAGVVVDSNIGSHDNWARYRLRGSSGGLAESGTGRLSFFTLWQNPQKKSVVVAAGARLVVNAHLSVEASWNGFAAWFISGSEARATVRARMTVWALWDPALRWIVDDRTLASTGASGGFFGGDNSASVAFNEMMSGSVFTVPGQAYILIEVELLTEWLAADGSVRLDAESGAFRASVPHLALTLTEPVRRARAGRVREVLPGVQPAASDAPIAAPAPPAPPR